MEADRADRATQDEHLEKQPLTQGQPMMRLDLAEVEVAKAMGQNQNGSAAIQSPLRNWGGSGSTSVASTTDANELANVLRLTVYPQKRREAPAY